MIFFKTRERPCGIVIKTRDTDEGKIHVKYEYKYPECDKPIQCTSSDFWQEMNPDTVVYDPDGWDRKNFDYSWFLERITIEEYNNRVFNSTVMFHKNGKNKELQTKQEGFKTSIS